MSNPRKPTHQEKTELAFWLVCIDQAYPDFGSALGLIKSAAIAVFDDYATVNQSYVGKLMTVVWQRGPEGNDVFIWRNGKIVRAAQAEEFEIA